jgi:hypothetical protein
VVVAELVAPRVWAVPKGDRDLGDEACQFVRRHGLILDGWQELVLRDSLRTRPDNRWAAAEVGLNVPRQNGKGAVLEARELVGLFMLGERLIIHSAHEFATSSEHFRRLESVIRESPELLDEVAVNRRSEKAIRYSHGEESITLKSGSRIVFKTRTKGGARGFSCDVLVLDEAMVISEAAHAAMVPTLRASQSERGMQIWYAGSAVDQESMEHGLVWTRVRSRGVEGADPRLAYFEWSVDAAHPSELSDEALMDPRLWAAANPALGIRITEEHMELEQRSLDQRAFAVELLGVGDYPDPSGLVPTVISMEAWGALRDERSELEDPVVLAFDVSPDRRGSIVAAGRNQQGDLHVEVVENKQGTGWIPGRIAELVERHDVEEVVCDGFGPSASLIPAVEDQQVSVHATTSSELSKACGVLVDAVEQQTMRHLGSEELASAIRGAKARPLGDAWAWSRKNSGVDISPLVAATLGVWAAAQLPESGGQAIF